MQLSKNILKLLVAGTVLLSCNSKEPVVEPCKNGFLDPGETAPDCGGNCPPCATVALNDVYTEINGVSTTFTSKSFGFNPDFNSWVLVLVNDSLNIILDAGPDGTVDSYSWGDHTLFSFNNTTYPVKDNGVITISDKNTTDQIASGFFSGNFVLPGDGVNPPDTVKLRNGQFLQMEY